MLITLASQYPEQASLESVHRPFLQGPNLADSEVIQRSLDAEHKRERDAEAEYWKPLQKELEQLRWRKNG